MMSGVQGLHEKPRQRPAAHPGPTIDDVDYEDVADALDLAWLSLRPAEPVDPHILVRVTGRVADTGLA